MLFNDAQQAATLSAVVRPKSGQGSPMAKTCRQGRNCQPLLDTDGPDHSHFQIRDHWPSTLRAVTQVGMPASLSVNDRADP
jgi:hypothetical protein